MNNSTNVKGFLASVFGSLIGSVTTLQISHHNTYLTLLAGIIGFVVGYVSFNYKEVIADVPEAWSEACKGFEKFKEAVTPNPLNWVIRLKSWGYCAASCASGLIWLYVLIHFGVIVPKQDFVWYLWIPLMGAGIPIVLGGLYLLVGLVEALETRTEKLQSFLDYSRVVVFRTNSFHLLVIWPIFLLYILFYKAPKAIGGFVKQNGRPAVVVTGRFFKNLFLLTYSDPRLLFGVYGAIGAMTGYKFNHPLTFALLGGLFGVLNWEYVSKRKLHVVWTRE